MKKQGASSVLVTSAHPAVPGHGGPDSKAIRGLKTDPQKHDREHARLTRFGSRQLKGPHIHNLSFRVSGQGGQSATVA